MRARRRSRRGGFFPIPHYSGRTRRGNRFTVGGCCLPLPALTVTLGGLALRRLARREP